MSRVMAGSVNILSIASLWHLELSCIGNLVVASFQFLYPVDIYCKWFPYLKLRVACFVGKP